MKIFFKTFGIFNTKYKILFLSIIIFGLFIYFLELLTLSSLLPLITILIETQNFEDSKYGNIIFKIFNFFGFQNVKNNLIELIIFGFFGLFLIRTIFSILFIHFQNIVSAKLIIYIQSKFYDFYTNDDNENQNYNTLPTFLRVFQEDTARLVNYTQLYFEIFLDALFIFSVLFILSKVSLNITIISFILLFFSIIAVLFFTKNTIKNLSIKRQYFGVKSKEILQQIFSISIFIRLLKKQKFFKDKFVDLFVKQLKFENRKKFLVKSPKYIIEFFIVICFLVILYYFDNFLDKEKQKEFVPTLGFFLVCILRISPSINKITNSVQEMKYLKNSAILIMDIFLNQKNNIRINEKSSIKSFINDFNLIKFKNINFNYPNLKIFNNLNLEIKKSQKIGFISPSGSGKSTFISLLLGIIKPTEGRIEFDQVEYKHTSQISRNFFGYVPQSNFYFNSSIVENIALGEKKSSINQEHLNNILKIVGINSENFGNDFISKQIGENGSNCSGGQLQRISIARSLYFKPKFLILDEASNQLDKDSEEKLLSNILSNYKELTLVIISHNFSTIKNKLDLFEIKNFKISKIN